MKTDIQMEIATYLTYLAKPFLALKYLLFTQKGLSITLPTMAGVAALSDVTKAWYLLLLVYSIDFVTGILGSYTIQMNIEKTKDRYIKIKESTRLVKILYSIEFFVNNISSQKLRKSIIKAVGYTLFILLFWAVQEIFKIKTWTFDSFSHMEWNLTLMAQAGCIASEIWSILFENLKKMGFDLISKITGISKTYKEIKKEIKQED